MNEIRVGELEDDFFFLKKKKCQQRGDFGYNPEGNLSIKQKKPGGINPSDPISYFFIQKEKEIPTKLLKIFFFSN